MRKYLVPLMASMLSSLCVVCSAHGDPEDLGHHWHVAKYISEVRLQTAVMLAFIGCVVAVVLIKRLLPRRENRI